jgi:hypothetical protein
MINVLMIAERIVCALRIFVLAVLVWKTTEYFNRLPANDKNKPILAWDVLMLGIWTLVSLIELIAG